MKRGSVLAIAAALLCAAALTWKIAAPSKEPAEHATTGAPSGAAPASAIRLGCTFEVGDRAAFVLDSSVEARSTPAQSPTDAFKGILSWEVVDASKPGEWLLRAALTSTELHQSLSQPSQRVTELLDSVFMVRVGEDCRFVGMGYSRSWQAATRRFVSSTLGTYEFVFADPTSTKWKVDQTDGMGRYTASYVAARGPSGAVEVTKEKQAYHADDRGKALGIAVELLLGKATANPNAERRWLDAASGAEQVRVRAQGSVLADLEQRYRIVRKDDAFVRPDPNVTADSLDFQDAFAMTTTVDAPTDPTIPGLTLDAAMKRFSDIYQKAKNGDAYAAALFLAEWLKGGPGRAEKLLAMLKGGQVPEALRPALFLALQRCDTPEARGVLQKALTDKALPEMDRARAASALSDIPHPTPESAHALVQSSVEAETKLVAGTSVRALGHLAERGAALGPELQGELRDTLREDLKGAKTTSRAVDVLDAIGNTGDKSLLPDVAQHLSDDSMALREHSARALRNMPVADATALIVPRLQTETDPGVRTALVDTGAALGIRDPNALALAASELATEPSPTVRASLIRWLGAEVDVPTAKAALIAQFHREQVPQLLQLIGHYVSADDLR